jgi:hypothetical protein
MQAGGAVFINGEQTKVEVQGCVFENNTATAFVRFGLNIASMELCMRSHILILTLPCSLEEQFMGYMGLSLWREIRRSPPTMPWPV